MPAPIAKPKTGPSRPRAKPRPVRLAPIRSGYDWYGEYEKQEAVRDNYTHANAVRIVQRLSDEYRQGPHVMDHITVDRLALIDALTKKKIRFVLTGMYGIVSWLGRPRATHDVDFLVKGGRVYGRALKVIKELYPQLEPVQFAGVTGFFVPGEKLSLIDLSYPHRPDLEVTLKEAVWTEDAGRRYRIPLLEAAIANKYGAMIQFTRDSFKRAQDSVDFAMMVKHSTDPGREPIDMEKLGEIVDKAWPHGGRAELFKLVEEAKAGKVPRVDC